jgi:hypothetical protein
VNAASGFSQNLTIRADSAPATSAVKTHATVASRFAGTVSGKSGNFFAGFTIRKSQPTLHKKQLSTDGATHSLLAPFDFCKTLLVFRLTSA